MAADFLSGERLYQDVVTYHQLGEHRTATEGDTMTAEWITEQLQAAGLQTSHQTFSLRQFVVRESSLVVAGEPVKCFPWWCPRGTGPRPLRARLAPFGAGADLQGYQ